MASRANRSSRRDPEDALLRRIQSRVGGDKGRAVAIAKSQGLVRQEGRHLEPTEKGRRAARKARRKKG